MNLISYPMSDSGIEFLVGTPDVSGLDFNELREGTAEASACTRELKHLGKTVAMAGITPHRAGVGSAWIWIGPDAQSHMLSLTRIIIKELLPEADLVFGRLQAEVEASNQSAIHYIEMLGFERESLMENFGAHAEGDFFMYRRLSRHYQRH
jgi:RimJ/RimL family protein N-acetyltransferase